MTVNKFLLRRFKALEVVVSTYHFKKNWPRRGEILVAPGMARGKVRPTTFAILPKQNCITGLSAIPFSRNCKIFGLPEPGASPRHTPIFDPAGVGLIMIPQIPSIQS